VSQDQSNAFLVVATNAKTFDTNGILQVFGTDGVHNVNGQISGIFEPTQAPEPSSALLLGLGLVGIAAFRKRLTT
jgi:PEP-CTERM motif